MFNGPTVHIEDGPGCVLAVSVEGPADVFALVRTFHRGEGENPTPDDGAAADAVAWASWQEPNI